MADRSPDPYLTLGVTPDAPDSELRAAYRRLVQLHHPDHNAGSAESARRFEAVQEAYAQIRTMRQAAAAGASRAGSGQGARRPPTAGQGPRRPPTARQGSRRPETGEAPADTNVESRLADLERELQEAREARERARRAAREAASAAAASQPSADGARPRPSDEELGYIETDDSFAKILADAASEFSERLSSAQHDVPKRVSDLIDELAWKLTGEPPSR